MTGALVASPPAAAAPARRGATAAAIAGLVLLALALRVPQLDQSLFGDELFAYDEVAGRSFGGMWDAVLNGAEVTPPLYFCLAWLAQQVGDPVVWLRVPSLLAGLALVPVTYALGRELAGPRAALVAAGFIAVSPHAIFYAVEARPYELLALLVAGTTVCLLRALEGRGRAWWAAYSVLSLLAVATHLTAIFVLGAQALWALWAHRGAWRPLVAANAVAALAFAPWLPRLRRDDVGWLLNLYGGFDPSPREFADEVAHFLWGWRFAGLDELPGTVVSIVCAAALVAIAAAGLVAASRRRPTPRELLLLALPCAVVAGLFANSALSDRDLVSERNLTSALPYVAVLIGVLVTRLPRRPAVLAGVIVLGVPALTSLQALGAEGQRPRYKDAAAFVEASARPDDVVLERLLFPAFGEFGRPLTRHLEIHLDPRLELVRDTRGEREADAIGAAERTGGRLFLVQTGPEDAVGLPERLGALRLAERRQWPGIETIAVGIYE